MKKAFKNSLFLFLGLGLFMSCSSDDDATPEDLVQLDPPIMLDCNYFNEDRILTDNPNAAVDYIIDCVMRVSADIIIEPGVVIEFGQNAGIEIDDFNVPYASLSAEGTAAKPIVFRGVVSGAGYWRGILFDSSNIKNELKYVTIDGAGGQSFNSNGDRGAVITWADAHLVLTNSSIVNSASYGLNASYGDANIELHTNSFENNDAPVKIHPQYINAVNSSNDYTGNSKDFVFVESGTVDIATTWKKINVPYVVMNTSVYNYNGGINIRNVMTVEPGVVIEFDSSTKLNLPDDTGAIKAIGTAMDPIIFTAVNKVQNGWIGFYFDSDHPLNEIAFAEFHYSGKTTGTAADQRGTIRLWYDNLLNIHDVSFHNINGCAINYGILFGQSDNPLLTYNNITVDAGGCDISCFGQGCN